MRYVVAVALALGFAQTGWAADLPVKAPARVSAPIGWTGFYAGGNGGYAWAGSGSAIISPDTGTNNLFTFPAIGPGAGTPQTGTATFSPRGGFAGGQVGYNYQFQPNWVAGVEADIQGAWIEGSGRGPIKTVFSDPFFGLPDWAVTASSKVNWFGTVRGRIGFLPTNMLLLYATGGLAYGEVERSSSVLSTFPAPGFTAVNVTFFCANSTVCFSQTDRNTQFGWTAGAGAEYALTSRLTVKAEYLHVDLGGGNRTALLRATQPPGTATMVASFGGATQFDLARVGFNYRFDPAR